MEASSFVTPGAGRFIAVTDTYFLKFALSGWVQLTARGDKTVVIA